MPRRPHPYVTRPAICLERRTVRANAQIQYELKNPFSDGAMYVLFSHLDFLSKLAALVPRPRHNLVRYHGVLVRGCRQPNARMRKLIVPAKRKKTKSKLDQNEGKSIAKPEAEDDLIAPLTWAQRRSGEPLKRVFERAAIGLIFPCTHCVAAPCVSSPISLTQT